MQARQIKRDIFTFNGLKINIGLSALNFHSCTAKFCYVNAICAIAWRGDLNAGQRLRSGCIHLVQQVPPSVPQNKRVTDKHEISMVEKKNA